MGTHAARDDISDHVQAKLQALEEQQGDQPSASSAGVAAIAWRGTTSVVSAERVRVALGQALDLSKQVSMCLSQAPFRRCPTNCLGEWCIAQRRLVHPCQIACLKPQG